MYRAILDGIALEQRLLIEGVEAATATPITEILMLGGGSRSPLWCHIMADVLGRSGRLVREQECTALGAGIHAAAAVGFYPNIRAAADAMTGVDKTYSPDGASHRIYSGIFQAYRSLYPNLKSTFQSIAENMP